MCLSKYKNHQQIRPIVLTSYISLCFLSLWLIQLPEVLHFNFSKYWANIPLWDTLKRKNFIYIKGCLCFQNTKKWTQTQYGLNVTVHIQIQPGSYDFIWFVFLLNMHLYFIGGKLCVATHRVLPIIIIIIMIVIIISIHFSNHYPFKHLRWYAFA